MTTAPEGVVYLEANEDLKQYGAVELNSGKLELTDGNTDEVFGIVQTQTEHAKSGDEVAVKTRGPTKALIDGSTTNISVGDKLAPKGSATSGKLIKTTSGDGNAVAGEVIDDNLDGTSDGEEALIRLYNYDRSTTN